ncbi:asparagine synthase family protein [Marichromatium bheemlicum]|uniref:asparagine synthase (glutamine-hydrolyzing) n=1 Tax=Marichromatium bheemlicum TaxID=365339 RepID=A0ABX1I9M7_9GAMM|nr:asparagine synthetase B family protein [Marichromatium bheemlicum]NKN33901.1 asparagine synthase [Marichromatium bheemlicum]
MSGLTLSIDPAQQLTPLTLRETVVTRPGLTLDLDPVAREPARSWEDRRALVLLDGWIEGCEREPPRRLVEALLDQDWSRAETVLTGLDGDFVLFIHDKASARWLIINDLLGRRPLYLLEHPGAILVTRDIARAVAADPAPRTDTLGAAEMLLFGHGLGARTPWRAISLLPPATLLQIEPDALATRRTLARLDLVPDASDGGLAHHAAILGDHLVTACERLVTRGETAILALSGGLDSRAVAAGLAATGTPFSAATMARAGWYNPQEHQLAAMVARHLGSPWECYEVPPSRGADYLRLLRLKQGLNDLDLAFHLPFFDHLRAQHETSVVYLTGDGGDKLLPDLGAGLALRDAPAACDYAVARRGRFTLDECAALLGLERRRLEHALQAHFAAYAEDDGNALYTRFLIEERARRWLFEGEDRNRHWFTSATPFYSLPFVRAALACPRALKRDYRLYRALLERLDPTLARLPRAGIPGALGSPRFVLQHRLTTFAKAHPRPARWLQQRLRRPRGLSSDAPVLTLLRHQLAHSPALDPGVWQPLLADADRRPRTQLLALLNLATLIDPARGAAGLDAWRDQPMP